MYRVAWLTCVLLALAGARRYERCELARELLALGVRPDHVSTWVCIAYHESRFDTAAKNHYSGDHGIFQISELYWCGPGKACGLPCSALRDDDISNDLECALRVHEEHTRLQGNGFLAWVVYPQHCKHNTKKYLVDCDTNVKYTVPITRSRTNYYDDNFNNPNVTYKKQNIENLLPPYLAIGSIFRGSYGKVLDQNRENIDWYNYKINNIDELKLPVFDKPSQPYSMPPTTTERTTTTSTARTTTTPEPYIPRVKVWRTIETNQFRKKQKTTPKSATEKDYTTQPVTTPNTRLTAYTSPTNTPRPVYSTTVAYLQNATSTTLRSTSVTTTSYSPTTTVTTNRPTYPTTTQTPTTRAKTTTAAQNTVTYTSRTLAERPTSSILSKNIETTTIKPRTEQPTAITIAPYHFVFTTTNRPSDSTTVKPSIVTTHPRNTVTTTYRAWTSTTEKPTTKASPWSTTYKSWFTTTARPTTTTERVITNTASSKSAVTTTSRPWYTARPTINTIAPRSSFTTTYKPWFTTTEKPITTTFSPNKIVTTSHRPSTTTSTRRPTTVQVRNTVRTTASTTQRPVTTTNKAITKTDFSWYTFTSRTATTPPTTKQQSTSQSSKPAFPTQTKTNAPYTSTESGRHTSTARPDTTPKPRTTQSIFDLYLNPTKPPKLPRYSPPDNKYRLKIFAGGTTTPASVMQSTASIDPAKNYIRRQALRDSHDK
ncbi:unnamed protein product [Chrysodeixis includens]|uniref:Lysozyme n=1 Tax=Chrysodeixis includens TaxID=689277 RepID=A0A9P0BMJ7_CHRIL|nr:unnamed protein product [Chrysodeixis includens]